ncbi:MAG TPA: FkbM family methyltransferase [Terriglobales bacterium]|nr:FkbM family methyltransferase [Terriglobales bacterium]
MRPQRHLPVCKPRPKGVMIPSAAPPPSSPRPSFVPRAPAAAAQPWLIMDVGMLWGLDTRFYLAKGFRVVGIEARPDVVAHTRCAFAADISAGNLEIVHCAVASRAGPVPFWVFPDKDEWGTLDRGFAERNIGRGLAHHIETVPGRRFEQVLAEHGIPYFLKIDIEGADLLCLAALAEFEERPPYVSIELNLSATEAALEPLRRLRELGYSRFQLVNQALNPARRPPRPAREGDYVPTRFALGTSGLFGAELPGRWLDEAAAARRVAAVVRRDQRFGDEGRWANWATAGRACGRAAAIVRARRWWPGALRAAAWYDLHACK